MIVLLDDNDLNKDEEPNSMYNFSKVLSNDNINRAEYIAYVSTSKRTVKIFKEKRKGNFFQVIKYIIKTYL